MLVHQSVLKFTKAVDADQSMDRLLPSAGFLQRPPWRQAEALKGHRPWSPEGRSCDRSPDLEAGDVK